MVAARRYRFLRDRAARRIQPVVRGWFARRFVAWKKENEWAAVKMTKVVRGFLARCEFKRRLALRYLETKVYPAVRRIQRIWRGYRGRLVAKRLLEEKHQVEVVIPAAIAAQKFLRRLQARQKAARLRLVSIAPYPPIVREERRGGGGSASLLSTVLLCPALRSVPLYALPRSTLCPALRSALLCSALLCSALLCDEIYPTLERTART